MSDETGALILDRILVPKILTMTSLLFTSFGFFLIINKSKTTTIEYLMMIMCFSESISF
jgi:hypothetical protein